MNFGKLNFLPKRIGGQSSIMSIGQFVTFDRKGTIEASNPKNFVIIADMRQA